MKCKDLLPLFAAVAVFLLFFPASSQARTTHIKAQNSTNFPNSTAAQQEAMQMVPAEAVLKDRIDARKLDPGAKFQAALSGKVRLKSGAELPRGTELIGKVVRDKMQADGTSTLALRFTRARLKDGKVIPIKATIVGVTSPADFDVSWDASPAVYWSDKTLRVDQVNVESGINLHSAIASANSGVFVTTKKDDVKLPEGARLLLAIGPGGASHQRSMGSANAGASSGA